MFEDKHCVSCNLIPLSCVGIRVGSLQSSAVIVPVLCIFSRFVPLGNWWHESTVTDCRSCCDLSTMWPILIRPVVFVISLELKNLRVYFWTNGLKKKGKRVQKSNTQVYDSLTQILTVKTAMALKCQELGCAFRANSGSGKKVLKLHWTAVTLPCKQCSFTFRDARPGGPWKLVWEEK